MANFTEPYTNLTLTNEGFFRTKNNRLLDFSISDVKSIYKQINNTGFKLSELIQNTDLSEFTVRRIVNTINAGLFDEYLTDVTINNNDENNVNDDHIIGKTININDIHITINNNYNHAETETEPLSEIKTSPSVKKVTNKQLKDWSKKIRRRDDYTCVNCGKVDTEHSQAHHIFPKSRFPFLACDEGNGVTLCQKCHADYHKRYLGSENAYNFFRWLNEFR